AHGAPPDRAAASASVSASVSAPVPDPLAGGRAPMPLDAAVPARWLPPGANVSPLPSEEIFAPQTIPIRFNHKKHVKELGQACTTCHPGATTSNDGADNLLPDPARACDGCHGASHADR